MDNRPIRRSAVLLCAAGILLLAACGRVDVSQSPNEAPPAAPFGLNVQNQNDDNNILNHRESTMAHDEGTGNGTAAATDSPAMPHQISEAVAEIEGVHTAHVLLAGDKAYVAVTLRDGNGLEMAGDGTGSGMISRTLRGAISDKVRSLVPAVKHVYVTDRSEDVRRFETLSTNLREGRSVDNLVRELSESVTRSIPDWSLRNLPTAR